MQDQHGSLLRREPSGGVPHARERALTSQALDGIHAERRLLLERRWDVVARALLTSEHLVPPAVLAAMVETEIDEQPVEPRREPGTPAKAARRLPEPDERLLREVPRVLAVTQDRPGEPEGSLLVALHEQVEGGLLAAHDPLAEDFI